VKSKLVEVAEDIMRSDSSVQIAIGVKHVKVTTGKISSKKYKCTSCGHISAQETNHYGLIYPRCTACGWKHPLEMGQVHICLEPVPTGWGVPAPWKTVTLGEICEIKEVRVCPAK
jgi:hypothetical protein